MPFHKSALLFLASASALAIAPSAIASTFTLVTVPDTQFYAYDVQFNLPVTGLPASLVGAGSGQEGLPANRITLFNAQTQWVKDNQVSQNIQFLSHLGDIVQDATTSEFARVQPAFARLDSIGPNFVYSTVPGNHDYQPGGLGKRADTPAATALANYVDNFGPDRYAGRTWYGGASSNGANSYQFFQGGGRNYLHIGLEYNPNNIYNNDSAIQWAQGVINANPGIPTIVSTHALITDSPNALGGNANPNSPPQNPNAGQDAGGIVLYRDLIRNNDQIFMTFNGHYHALPNGIDGERFETTINNSGRPVHTILSDYQDYPNGGDGYLRNYVFDDASNKIYAITYSPREGATNAAAGLGTEATRFFQASPTNPYDMPGGLPDITSGTFQIDANSKFEIDLDFNSRLRNFAAPQAAPKGSFAASGYQQNFDSMGDGSGNALYASREAPTGFRVLSLPGGNTTYTDATGISILPATDPLSSFTYTGYLTVNSTYGGGTPSLLNNNNGLNAALASSPLDRILATAPTGTGAAGIELQLLNNSGATIRGLDLAYDIVRLNSVATANELPGYQLFYSQDLGDTWTNIAGLNPTLAGTSGVVVPNSIGTTKVSGSFALARSWDAGQSLYFRWMDDNADQTSPDQIIGLNNLSITAATTAVPEPFTIVGTMIGGAAALRIRKRLKATNKL